MKGNNASAASCHRGYGIYYRAKAGGRILPIDTINDFMVRLGYDKVSPRTYRNYRKNYEAGHTPEQYVPINRTDYNVAAGPSDVPSAFIDAGRV